MEWAVGGFCLFHESPDDVDGLRAGPVGSEAILCFAQLCVNGRGESGLEESGKEFVGCVEETDGSIVFWVCVCCLCS